MWKHRSLPSLGTPGSRFPLERARTFDAYRRPEYFSQIDSALDDDTEVGTAAEVTEDSEDNNSQSDTEASEAPGVFGSETDIEIHNTYPIKAYDAVTQEQLYDIDGELFNIDGLELWAKKYPDLTAKEVRKKLNKYGFNSYKTEPQPELQHRQRDLYIVHHWKKASGGDEAFLEGKLNYLGLPLSWLKRNRVPSW